MNTYLNPKNPNRILDRAAAGERLSADEILALHDLPADEVAQAAHQARLRACSTHIGSCIDR